LQYGNGESIWEKIPFGDFLVNPQTVTNSISERVRLVTEPSPYGNWPSLGSNFKMVSQNGISFPFDDLVMETGSLMF
jgi:hypothetical protein